MPLKQWLGQRLAMNLNWRHKGALFVTVVATALALLLDVSAKQIAGIAMLGTAFAWIFGSLSLRALGLLFFSLISAVGFYVAAMPVWQGWNSFSVSASEYDSAMIKVRAGIAKSKVETSPHFIPAEPTKPRWRESEAGHEYVRAGDIFDQVAMKQVPAMDSLKKSVTPGAETVDSLAGAFKKKYPQYADLSNLELVRRVIQKYPTCQAWLGKEEVQRILSARIVELPESARDWVRPELIEGDWVQVSFEFPGSQSDLEIMQKFETKVLRPRPTFSFAAAVRSHLWSFSGGMLLLAAGLCGWVWLLRRRRQGTPKESSAAARA